MTITHFSILDIGGHLFKFDNDFVSNYEENSNKNFLYTAKDALRQKYQTNNFFSLVQSIPEAELYNTIKEFMLHELPILDSPFTSPQFISL